MISFLKKLFGLGGTSRDEGLYLYVRCDNCGAVLHTRIDVQREVAPDFERGGYILRKEMMDSTCFKLLYADLRFDEGRNLIERSIDGGTFITREEWATEKEGIAPSSTPSRR